MINQRKHKRFDYVCNCQLHVKDSSYRAQVDNFSMSGFRLNVSDMLPDLNIGHTCELSLGKESLFKMACTVVRIEASIIALQLIGLTA